MYSGKVSTSDATAITNYAGPGPAAGSGAHCYVILVLPQPDDFSPPSNLSSPNTPLGVFGLTDYISVCLLLRTPELLSLTALPLAQTSKLGQPIAGTYFTVEEGTASVSASATSAVNTQSISAALAAASPSATGSASGSASGSAASSAPTGNSASAIQFVSGPLAFIATLFGLVVL